MSSAYHPQPDGQITNGTAKLDCGRYVESMHIGLQRELGIALAAHGIRLQQ